MKFFSTRDHSRIVTASQAIAQGLSDEGGLFVPESFPQVDVEALCQLDYPELAAAVVSEYLTDYSKDFLAEAARTTYGEAFGGKAGYLAPVEGDTYALELWHGPTCAFKDYALQLMPKLLVEAKKNLSRTEKTLILVATSGDTGKAALDGYHDIPGVEIAVFYPTGGTSEIQRLQMATQEGANVAVYAVRGNFDDAQTGVKKVFVRSGIRYDYLLEDKGSSFLSELVKYHISGQLKVAPEHCIDSVLDYMGKPHIGTYERFMDEYRQLNHKYDKEQYVVPYLMSSHPGSTLSDAVALAEYLNRRGRQPEQVQDFYPTPGTISTCMYHTGIDPRTMQPVYVAKTPHEKDMQRALLQWRRPDKRRLVIQALHEAGREDLIGFGKDCLVRPMTDRRKPAKPAEPQPPQRKYGKVYGGGKKPASARSAQNAKSGKSGGRSAQPPRGKGGRR